MNIPIRHNHAAICFAVLGLFTLVCGVGCIALSFALLHWLNPGGTFPWRLALLGIGFCFVAVCCIWSAWVLFKRTPRAGLIAMIIWLVVGILTLWLFFNINFSRLDIVGIIIVAVLAVLESLIGIYLFERRHEAST